MAFTTDTYTYVSCARELLRFGTFTMNGEPQLIRTPGYPLFLIPGVALGHEQGVTIALQIAVSLFSTIGAYVLALALTKDRRAGLVAAALYAVEPASIALTAYMLTETLAASLLVWGIWLVVRYMRSSRPAHLAGAIVLLAAAAYVRPVTLFLPACIVVFLALHALMSRQWRSLSHALVAGLLAVALLLPWSLRNRAAGFPGFSAIGAIGAYFFGAAQVLADQNGISQYEQTVRMGWAGGAEWVNEDRYLQMHPEQRTWSQGQRYFYMQREGVRVIKSNLPRYALIHARGMFYTLISSGGGELDALFGRPFPKVRFAERVRRGGLSTSDFVHVVLGLFLVALYLLTAYWVATTPWNPSGLLVLGSAMYMIAAAGGIVAETRFRVPVMPLVCALAGAGLVTASDRLRGRERMDGGRD